MTEANGDIFICDWVRGKKEGYCIEIKINGEKKEGKQQDGIYSGKCKFTYANGDTYVGEYHEGKKDGKGVEVINGIKVTGTWLKNEKNG